MDIIKDEVKWGEMQTEQDGNRVMFHAAGALPKYGEILRVWGMRDGHQPLLIGVAEPDGDQLAVNRSMTKQYLASFGYWPNLPQQYYAGIYPPKIQNKPAVRDPLIERVMRDKEVDVQKKADIDILSCRFAGDCAFPLAFAACCCTVYGDRAQLIWDRKKGCPVWTAPE